MVTNYYTLFHLAAEFDREFAGMTMGEVFTQHRGELVMSFREISAVIIIGCEPSNNYLYFRKEFARARKNSVDLFESIIGTHIERISIHSYDREITFFLSQGKRLIAQVFGSKANIFLIDTNGVIRDAFLKKIKFLGTKKVDQLIQSDFHSVEELRRQIVLIDIPFADLRSRMKSTFPRLGGVLIQELFFRCGIDKMQRVDDLTENELKHILESTLQLISELKGTPSPRIYFHKSTSLQFSVIALHSFDQYNCRLYDSVSEGIRVYLSSKQATLSFQQEKSVFENVVQKEFDHIERTLKKYESEITTVAQADELELKAKLLMAHLYNLHKGMNETLVENILQRSPEHVLIALDPHLTPAKNAERYFEKAKKAHSTIEEQRGRKEVLHKRLHQLESVARNLELVESSDDLKEFQDMHQEVLDSIGLKVSKSGRVIKKEPLPFRVFTVAGRFQVWAGKSSENNDLLTTRHTAKNDLWFHARSVGGSHVVLKVGTGKGEVPKLAIEQAAAIAAYYSKMKNSKLVPVTICEGKYVRKSRGSPAGTVTVEREKTLFVEPKLPKQINGVHL